MSSPPAGADGVLLDAMPCADHASSNSKCIACFTADVIELTHSIDERTVKQRQSALAKRYAALAPTGDDADRCKSVIFGLNTQLVARKLPLFGAQGGQLIAPGAITGQHRLLHRANLRRMGTWIGVTELQVVARLLGIRFRVGFPARPRPLAYEVGDPLDPLVGPVGLYWSGDHYQVATLTPQMGGGFAVTGLVATNPLGDCALESVMLFLLAAQVASPLVLNPIMAGYHWSLRSVVRQFRAAAAAPPVDGLVDATLRDYIDAITDLRALLVARMSDAEVDDAIIAEGELPESDEDREARRVHKTGGKVTGPLLALDGDAALPWGALFAISVKRLGQTGMQPVRFQRIAGTRVQVAGGNFVPSEALIDGSVAFVRAALARPLKGGHDEENAFYSEQIARKSLGFVDDEGLGMSPRSTHICSCLAAITTRDGTTRYFLFAAVNMQPGKGDGARPVVSTLKKGESGTHSEKICFGLLAHVLRGFGLVLGGSVLAPLADCCRVDPRGAAEVHTVTRVDVMFMNIAAMCITCEGFWGQFREALLAAGVEQARCYTWYFAGDIKNWK